MCHMLSVDRQPGERPPRTEPSRAGLDGEMAVRAVAHLGFDVTNLGHEMTNLGHDVRNLGSKCA